jgi:DNA-binding MarR family transcriptional regulator
MTTESPRAATTPVVDALVQLSFAVLGVLNRSSAEHDLSVTQLRLMGILRDRNPSMAELADFLRLDRSSVSGLIDRAERRGLVTRTTSPQDARVTIISLTPAGMEVGERVAATVNTRIEHLVESVAASERPRIVRLAAAITSSRFMSPSIDAP